MPTQMTLEVKKIPKMFELQKSYPTNFLPFGSKTEPSLNPHLLIIPGWAFSLNNIWICHLDRTHP